MPTIREVAEKAGVSFTTVSHVINNTRFVSEETRNRVLRAMLDLNYRPNALAQSLRSGKTHTLGMILPDSSNPFFAEIGRTIENETFKLGYSVILCNAEGDPNKERTYVNVLIQKQVDGVIFVATGDQANSLDVLLEQGLPVVLVDRDLPEYQVDAVFTNNLQGGLLATRHLVCLGHRRIAFIGRPAHLTPSAERVKGYCQALEEAGLPQDEALIVRGTIHSDTTRGLVRQLMRLPEPPTAIFAYNDLMALAVLRSLQQMGCRVPEDIAVVGYDDIDLARFSTPPLTTVAQPKREMAILAVQLLVARMADKHQPLRREILPSYLVVRESTTPCPQEEVERAAQG